MWPTEWKAALVLETDWPWGWARLSNILHKSGQGGSFCCPLHAWHLPSNKETVLLEETQNSCSMSKPRCELCDTCHWVFYSRSALNEICSQALWDVKLGLCFLDIIVYLTATIAAVPWSISQYALFNGCFYSFFFLHFLSLHDNTPLLPLHSVWILLLLVSSLLLYTFLFTNYIVTFL